MAGNIHEVSDANFQEEVLNANLPVLVDFWATWCAPCRALAPTIDAISKDYSDKIKFCKVDVDHNPNYAAQFGVRSIPTLILFKNGKSQGHILGNVPRGAIEELIKKVSPA